MGTYLGLPTELCQWAATGRRGSHPNTIPRYAVTPRGERSMVIVPQEVSKPWPMAFGTLAGDIPDDARTSVSAREKVLILDFSTQPQPVKARVGAPRKCEKLKKNLRSARFFFTCWALFRQGRRWRTQHGAAVADATRPCGLALLA